MKFVNRKLKMILCKYELFSLVCQFSIKKFYVTLEIFFVACYLELFKRNKKEICMQYVRMDAIWIRHYTAEPNRLTTELLEASSSLPDVSATSHFQRILMKDSKT